MRPPTTFRFRHATRALLACLLAAAALAATSANASAATTVSSNWSGYAVTGTTFKTVSATWVQPTASCSARTSATTASAFWIGLGGDTDSSSSLEQAGTEADCLANGTVRYSAWYELVPKASVKAALKVSAGDRISATVSAAGHAVTLKLHDLTTGRTFAKTLRMSAPDVSSAEWVAEAPSALTPGGASVLPLTDFGTVKFSNAAATSTGGHTGAISDQAWSATRIDLVSRGGGPGSFSPFTAYDPETTEAITSGLSASGTAFSVNYRRSAATSAGSAY